MSAVTRRGLAVVLAGGAVACSVSLDLESLEAGCPADTKECYGACVPRDNPQTGCGREGCAPCVVDHAAVVSCRTDNNECYPRSCEVGFGDCTVASGTLLTNCQTNFNEDVSNCRECGKTCLPATHAKAACGGGNCYALCDVGWGDCTAEDGCETNLLTDVNNCGKCGNVCPSSRPNSQAVCDDGACPCLPGHADCDQLSLTNGCETDIWNDPSNCGACGVACADGLICSAGACVTP